MARVAPRWLVNTGLSQHYLEQWPTLLSCCYFQQRLKALGKHVFEIEDERNRSDHTLNNITKTHDKITVEGRLTPYYQVSAVVKQFAKAYFIG